MTTRTKQIAHEINYGSSNWLMERNLHNRKVLMKGLIITIVLVGLLIAGIYYQDKQVKQWSQIERTENLQTLPVLSQ